MNWLFSLLKRDSAERRLDQELRHHLDRLTEDYVSAGFSRAEARRKARLEFGGLDQVKEECRQARGTAIIESTVQDVRHAARLMRKNPGFTAVAALSLALGIGANTAIFSVIHTLMFRMLPVRAPEQLFALGTNDSAAWGRWPYAFYTLLRDQSRVFSDVAASHVVERFNVTCQGQVDEGKVRVALVSGNYFAMLGVGSAIGRVISPDDGRVPGGAPVALVSYAYWERRFARSPAVLNQSISFNGAAYTIIGVAARGFSGDWVGQPADLWIPVTMQAQAMPEAPNSLGNPGFGWLTILTRTQPGIALEQAQAAANLLHEQFERDSFGPALGRRERPFPAIELKNAATGYSPERRVFARPLGILMVVVGLVLFIACANIANLLLARSSARQREIAVRLAMGAGPGRILRQWMTESILLSLLGGSLGLLFASWGTTMLLKVIESGTQPVFLEVHPDARVLGFTLGVSLLTGFLCGIGPAWRASRVTVSPALKGESIGFSRLRGFRFGLGKTLVVSQVALSLVLLIGAGLFIRTLRNLKSQDYGFDRDRLLVVWTGPGQTAIKGQPLVILQRTIRERISALPGVISVSQSSTGLLNGNYFWINGTERLRAIGQTPKPGGRWTLSTASPSFFGTVGIPLLLGRDFNEQDTQHSLNDTVAILNSALASFLFGKENPIGQRLDLGNGAHTTVEIVGVVSDARSVTPRERNLGMIYLPTLQSETGGGFCLVIKTSGPPDILISRIRQEFREVAPTLPVLGIGTIGQQLEETLASERWIAQFTGFFGVLALLLASLGLFGVISYTSVRRTAEMGLRLALGASRGDVIRMILAESLWVVASGLAIGITTALVSARWIQSALYGVSRSDPWTIAAATFLMISVALVAAVLPARKASRVDPIAALRYE